MSSIKRKSVRICGGVLATIGVMIFIHAAYSAVQHRVYLRIMEERFNSLPIDIIGQAIISVFITIAGITWATTEVKILEATKSLENKSIESLSTPPSFYSFKHRKPGMFRRYMMAHMDGVARKN